MAKLQPQTIQSAPEGSKETLRAIEKAFGFIPNLMATFANSPAVLKGYMALDAAWNESRLNAKERQLILLAVSIQNQCGYCKAAHSTLLKQALKVDAALVEAVRAGSTVGDAKLDALVRFTKDVVAERGFASEKAKSAFLAAGYDETQMMEVIVGVGLKTISNYIVHLNPITLDDAFKPEA